MRYSNDLRQRAMDLHFTYKKTLVDVSKLLKISYDTLKVWKRKYKENSLFEVQKSPGKPRTYDYEALKQFVKENPDKQLSEINTELFESKASTSGIWNALQKMDFKLKKKLNYTKKETKKNGQNLAKKFLN